MELYPDLKQRENITIILTTHYMEEADKLCDRIAIIDQSKIIALPQNLKEELEGETIIIESSDNQLLSVKLVEAKLADNIIENGKEINLSVKNAHTALPRIIELAVSLGIFIGSISIREPDLNDVFMHYTGRKYVILWKPRTFRHGCHNEGADKIGDFRGIYALWRRELVSFIREWSGCFPGTYWFKLYTVFVIRYYCP
ncbi:MAG: DUF4162 domain-containing protein [Methanobacteriaceae archaeon]|nr:DUF4162 domain-containing protein [Methanobacteriaceae archaeon]